MGHFQLGEKAADNDQLRGRKGARPAFKVEPQAGGRQKLGKKRGGWSRRIQGLISRVEEKEDWGDYEKTGQRKNAERKIVGIAVQNRIDGGTRASLKRPILGKTRSVKGASHHSHHLAWGRPAHGPKSAASLTSPQILCRSCASRN